MSFGGAVREKALDLVRRLVKVPIEARTGAVRHRLRHRRTLEDLPALPEALDRIANRWGLPEAPEGGAPVFVLSAGWRSGSTLLQRLVMSDPRVLVWGEPYDRCGYVPRLADTLRALGPDWPPDRYFLREREAAGRTRHAEEWIANLYPTVESLRAAHRAFFETLFERPAAERGYERWGFKEVRLPAGEARYLRWLFPDARFLFLVRHPFRAYRSYRIFRPWYDLWPEEPVFTPGHFGRHWAELAGSFVRGSDALGGRLIRFEDLTGGGVDVGDVSRYLDLDLDRGVLEKRVTGRGGAELADVPRAELRLLRDAVTPVAGELGYDLSL